MKGLRRQGSDSANRPGGGETPLRAELFSADQMEQHGVRLAAAHRLSPERMPEQLLARLAANEGVLLRTRNQLMSSVAAKRPITPASEWLLDNFYLIEEQIHTARRHLPKGYSRELPSLAEGASVGLPRTYDIALETIAHGDGRVDPDGLSRFVKAYQTVTPLRLGELWAIPIMLRLALIENLRRVATGIASGRRDRDLAAGWVDKLSEVARQDPKNLILVIADMARSNPPMTTPFVSEMMRQLQGQGPALAMPLTWIEQQLAESGLSIEQSVRSGNRQQAADQVSISNSIGSLRLLGTMDWRAFVEGVSVVELDLSKDPLDVYRAMDFASRDRYRHVVEDLAKASGKAEEIVARCAIELAEASATQLGSADRSAHVGYYLIDQGLSELESALQARFNPMMALRRWASRYPLPIYLGAGMLITLLLTALLLGRAWQDGVANGALAWLCVPTLLATSQLALALVNWLATLLSSPHPLPRLDFSKGIPADLRALVVVPTMLTSPRNVERLVEALEVRFLANRDDNLRFALLTDFADASEEIQEQDAPLLELAQTRIEALNRQYTRSGSDPFFLLHRPRRWNPHDRVWMGYERKRGKLADLNALLREGIRDGFSLIVGDATGLSGVKYEITLDTDTHLPRDAARTFVGTMAHPLNRPVYDETLARVRYGYGILQPRVSLSLPEARLSRYARLQGGEPGVDPYTRVISDVYQDLFGEGSFIGKGIYDIQAFERSINGRFPENRILSHDLLEGCHARSGLLSDLQVFEEYPSRYGADVDRRYRWIRGDWQLACWLLPWVPGADGRRLKNPLSALSRWKLFDNLRRSLVSVSLMLLLLMSWAAYSSAAFWTLAVLGILFMPPLLASLRDLLRKSEDIGLDQHVGTVLNTLGQRLIQAGFTLVTLPHEAFYSMQAILRTHWRLLVSHRRLLEWNPSGDQEQLSRTDLAASFRAMWIAPVLALFTAMGLVIVNPAVLMLAAPLLFLWLASPVIAWWISQPQARHEARLSAEQTRFLERIARKTWAFFETFVGPEEHWLPPDNYQEYRTATLAHRTSPTNMGLALLANLTAYDFGYIPAGVLVERTDRTLETMEGLERHRGHFLNWYDTQSLQPLHPAYISSVDSGNLAGHLLTLRPGLLTLLDRPILEQRWLDGLRTTFEILRETEEPVTTQLKPFLEILNSAFDDRPTTLQATKLWLDRLVQAAESIVHDFGDEAESHTGWWAMALQRQCQAMLDELLFLAPWAGLPTAADSWVDLPEIHIIPTLRSLAGFEVTLSPRLASLLTASASITAGQSAWLSELMRHIEQASARAQARIAAIQRLALQAGELANMEYGFLYDKTSRLLSIGYNLDERRRDASYYDLLASEARLSVFIAIAQGQLPQESWFA
ncbi:MAG: cyclic beta 1-2 glucan synthetase, partial [Candidatus Thiodiazotropha sp.]